MVEGAFLTHEGEQQGVLQAAPVSRQRFPRPACGDQVDVLAQRPLGRLEGDIRARGALGDFRRRGVLGGLLGGPGKMLDEGPEMITVLACGDQFGRPHHIPPEVCVDTCLIPMGRLW